MAESLPSDSSSLQSPEVFGKLNRETCVRVWYKLKAISGDGSLRGVDKVSFCNTLLGDHYGLFNKVEVENLTSIQKISDLSTPLLSALKRVGSPVLEAVRATLVTTKDEPGALQHSVIANTLLQCATEVHLEARKNTRSKTTNLELRSFHGDQAESDQNPLKVDVSRVESQDSGVHISKPSSGYDSRTSAIVYSEQHTVSSDVSPGAAQNPEGRSRTGKWESSAFVEELTGYLVDCMDQSDLCTFANEIIDGFVLGTRDKLKQQILDSVVQERHTLYYVARHLLAKNTLYKHIFKITDFTNSPIKMEFKEVLKSHIGRGWEQVASSMSMMNRTEIDQLVNRHSNDLYCQINEFLTHPLQFPRLPTKEETASLLVEIIEKASLPETARSVCHAFAAFLEVGVDDIRPGASSNFQAVDLQSVMNTTEDPHEENLGMLPGETECVATPSGGPAQQRTNQASQPTSQQPQKPQHATHVASQQQQQPQPSTRETAHLQQLGSWDSSTEQPGKPPIPTEQSQPSGEHPRSEIHNKGAHLQEAQQSSKIIEVECEDELDVCESDIPEFNLTEVLEQWFKAMVLVRRKDRKQAIHFAAELGYVQLLKDLLEAGHNGRAIMEGDKTPFLLACEEGHLSVVKELFSVFGAAVTSERDEHGRTCLHFPAVYRNSKLFAFLTVDVQASTKAVSNMGVLPLSVACLVGNTQAVDELLVFMSPPEKPQKSRMPPLHAAALGNHLGVLKHLIDKKYDYISDPNAKSENGFTPLHIAAARGNYDIVEYLVSHTDCNVNAAADDQTTPLLLAAMCNHPEIAQCLLQHGAGVDFHREIRKNVYHITPLGEAALGRNVEVATILMDHGANIMFKSGGTTSVLDHACIGGSEDFVTMLISKLEVTPGFADKFLDMFRSAFQVSVDFNDFKIAQIILNYLKSQLCTDSMDEVFETLRKSNGYNQSLLTAITHYKELVKAIPDNLPNEGSSVRRVAGGRTSVLYHIGYDDGPHWGTELMQTTLMFEDLKKQERFHTTYNRVYMEATKYVLRCVTSLREDGQSYHSLASEAAAMENHFAVEFYTNSKLRSRYADPEAFVQLGHAGHPTAISMACELVSQQLIEEGFGLFALTGEQYFAEVSKRNQEHPGTFGLKYQTPGNKPTPGVRLSDSHSYGGGDGSGYTSRSNTSRTQTWSSPSVPPPASTQPTGGTHQSTLGDDGWEKIPEEWLKQSDEGSTTNAHQSDHFTGSAEQLQCLVSAEQLQRSVSVEQHSGQTLVSEKLELNPSSEGELISEVSGNILITPNLSPTHSSSLTNYSSSSYHHDSISFEENGFKTVSNASTHTTELLNSESSLLPPELCTEDIDGSSYVMFPDGSTRPSYYGYKKHQDSHHKENSPELVTSQKPLGNQTISDQDQHDYIVNNHSDQITIAGLPNYLPMEQPDFQWGVIDARTLIESIDNAYQQIVHWKPNLFKIPSGNSGSHFVSTLTSLISAYADGTALECIALKAAMSMPALLLQRPHHHSNNGDHISLLKSRLAKWNRGDIDSLLHEGQTIQSRLPLRQNKVKETNPALHFTHLMETGNVKAALRIITDNPNPGLLPLDSIQPDGRTVKDHLVDKHPTRAKPSGIAILETNMDHDAHLVMFDTIDGDLIRAITLRTTGSAGPSGLDALGWRRMCSSFGKASAELCSAIARLAKRMCTNYVDPEGLTSLLASRLIALDKNPGVKPIGICEVLRRVISKAVLHITSMDILEVAGDVQLCPGQLGGSEAGVHAMSRIQAKEQTQAVLLVHASNAFNLLNREVAMRNTLKLCPPLAKMVINTYRENTPLFIDGEIILSQEGLSQGDPLAMSIYALATLPLIHKLPNDVDHIWYADNASAGGKIDCLSTWWSKLQEVGPQYGYHPNAEKSWLVVKEDFHPLALEVFADSRVNITVEGRQHLGAPIGLDSFKESFIAMKIDQWVKEIEQLSIIALSHPHSAYSALTNGLMSSWNYLMRVVPDFRNKLQPLEDVIRSKLLPAIIGQSSFSDVERRIFALPVREGGLGIPIPTEVTGDQFRDSCSITNPLLAVLINKDAGQYPKEFVSHIHMQQKQLKSESKKRRRETQGSVARNLKELLPFNHQRAVEFSSEKGASTWLTALPIKKYGFSLNKQAFHDALCIRYGWDPANLPTHCSCGTGIPFDSAHAFSCHKGGFPTIVCNRIRDLTAQLLTKVCPSVEIEPYLQPLSGETFHHRTANTDDNARLDVKARRFWGSSRRSAYFDVSVFNPSAPSYHNQTIQVAYQNNEQEKRRQYERRVIEIEHGSFTPLVIPTTGGMSPSANIFYKRLASKISSKYLTSYSETMMAIRCILAYSMIHSAVLCLRGAQSTSYRPTKLDLKDTLIDMIISQGHI